VLASVFDVQLLTLSPILERFCQMMADARAQARLRVVASHLLPASVAPADFKSAPAAAAVVMSPTGHWGALEGMDDGGRGGGGGVHTSAADGYQTAGTAQAYERGRPEYPTDALRHIAYDICRLNESDRIVVDVGAGTGTSRRPPLALSLRTGPACADRTTPA
jgi:hypothetical protein